MEGARSFTSLVVLAALSATVCCAAVQFCEGNDILYIIELGTGLLVTSPDYPADSYDIPQNCVIQFYADSGQPFGVEISQSTSSNCQVPYNVTGPNGNAPPHQFSTCQPDGNHMTYSVHTLSRYGLSLVLKINLAAGQGRQFTLSVSAHLLMSMKPTESTVNVTTTPTAYITSHQLFGVAPYTNNQHYKLTLTTATSSDVIAIEFIYMKLGDSTTCQKGNSVNDGIKIIQDELAEPVFECGDINSASNLQTVLVNDTSSVLFDFKSDNSLRFDGFLIKYTVNSISSKSTTATSTTSTTSNVPTTTTATTATTTKSTEDPTIPGKQITISTTGTEYPTQKSFPIAVISGVAVGSFSLGVVVAVAVTIAVIRCTRNNNVRKDEVTDVVHYKVADNYWNYWTSYSREYSWM